MARKYKVDFAEIRKYVTIKQILDHYELESQFENKGDNKTKGKCPIHVPGEDGDLEINLATNKWHCSHGSGGSVIDFVATWERISLKDAAERIAELFDIENAQGQGGARSEQPRDIEAEKSEEAEEAEEPSAEVTTLLFVLKNGDYAPAQDDEVLAAASSILLTRMYRGDVFSDPTSTKQYLSCRIGSREQEVFCTLFLDNRHRLISFDELFNGTIDGASVHPREVVKKALHHNAAAVILAHNHPSGVPEPSTADESLTRRLKEALSLVDVRVLDHIVVAGGETVSFAERGLL